MSADIEHFRSFHVSSKDQFQKLYSMKHILFILLLLASLTASAQLDALMQDAMNAKVNAYIDYDAERPTQMLEEAITKLKRLVPTQYKDIVVVQIADAYHQIGNAGHSYTDNGTTIINPALDSANVYYAMAVAADGNNPALRARLAETQVWAQQYDLARQNLSLAFQQDNTGQMKFETIEKIASLAYGMAIFADEMEETDGPAKKIALFERGLQMMLVLEKFAPDNEEIAMHIFQISALSHNQKIHAEYHQKLKAMNPGLSDAELLELLRTDGN
jgi:hypothetical protein